MKVLWLSGTPSLAENHYKNAPLTGGWIKSLEKAMKGKVELVILFYHYENADPVTIDGTRYIPISLYKKGAISKIKQRIFNLMESEKDIQLVLDVINEVKPDVIHIHGTEGPFGMIQKHTKVPCVTSIQGIIQFVLHNFFAGITFLDVLRYSYLIDWLFLRTQIHTYYWYAKTVKREKVIFENSRNIIGRTRWDRRVVTKVLAPHCNYYHNDEVLRDAFYNAKWDNDLNGTLVLYTTLSAVIYKGIETIFFVASLLDERNIDYRWEIGGANEKDAVTHLAAKSVGKKRRGANIHFLGRLNEEQLVDRMLNAHLFVYPSHIDISPNSLCEAMLLGVPCISTKVGGTASLLEDGKEGILVQTGEPYGMAGAIIEMAENFEQAKIYGQNGRTRALKRQDPEKITDDLMKIYQDIIGVNGKEVSKAIHTTNVI